MDLIQNRPIQKKILIGVKLQLIEPMCVSGGEAIHSDKDIIVDGAGEAFIPGTSLAGAARNYLGLEKDKKGLFGFAKRNGIGSLEDGSMSSLIISDVRMEKGWKTEIRDGVCLEEKVAKKGAKYDMQVITADVKGSFYMELTVRQDDSETDMVSFIKRFLCGLDRGEIRLGGSKNRGYGRVRVCRAVRKDFSKDNLKEWLHFDYKSSLLDELWKKGESEQQWDYQMDMADAERYHIFEIPLQLTGGISIRRYSARPMEADFEQMSHGGEAIIPGTSWAGAIRSRCRDILYSLDTEQFRVNPFRANSLLEKAFGKIKKEGEEDGASQQSCVVVGESRIQGGEDLYMSRNRIDRFSNATIGGALYTEKAHFQGDTTLRILIEKPHGSKELLEMQAVAGLVLLAVEDIKHGFLAVGGQTAVGRGVFCCKTERQEADETYMKALYKYLQEEG